MLIGLDLIVEQLISRNFDVAKEFRDKPNPLRDRKGVVTTTAKSEKSEKCADCGPEWHILLCNAIKFWNGTTVLPIHSPLYCQYSLLDCQYSLD